MNRLNLCFLLCFTAMLLTRCEKNVPRQSSKYPATPYPFEVPQGFPPPFIPADNPMTVEGVRLGRFLFYDKKLSTDFSMSCGSCHAQGAAFSDHRAFSTGVHGDHTRRNSMPLFNLAWQENFFWDGRAISLEEQALMPVTDKIELDNDWDLVVQRLQNDSLYPPMFQAAFGSRHISKSRVARAIAQFERSIVSASSKFDRVVRLKNGESFSASEQRGYEMFGNEIGDCFHCHSEVDTRFLMGAYGVNNQFVNNGLDTYLEQLKDLGRQEVTNDTNDRAKFKTAVLRNLSYSFPYMHDGSIPHLDSLIEFYNFGGHLTHSLGAMEAAGEGRRWTIQQKQDLLNFLKTLDDPGFLNDTSYSNPFERD